MSYHKLIALAYTYTYRRIIISYTCCLNYSYHVRELACNIKYYFGSFYELIPSGVTPEYNPMT